MIQCNITYSITCDVAKLSQLLGTGTTPAHSPLPKDDPLSLLRKQALFMQRSALKDLKEIGEGRWSLVWYPDPPISASLGVLHHQH
jgi:hypothetical protein